MQSKLFKHGMLAFIGGTIYGFVELLFRGYTHWSMVILGGLCFVAIGLINEFISWKMPFLYQMLIGGSIITVMELLTGLVVNVWLGWKIWDYSNMWGNFLGQICPLFSILWIFISSIAIITDDYVRFLLFNEEYPHYKFL